MKFMDKLNELYKNNNKLKIFLDMDGTVIECIFDSEESFAKEGGYLIKKPIKPILDQINEIKNTFQGIEINILSCSRNNIMTKEKDEWIERNIPYIKRENRIFLDKEDNTYTNENRDQVKAEYLRDNIGKDEIAILIDDNINVLEEAQEMLKEQVIPVHVTSLLI